jgi:hypothetical protein
MVGQEVEYVLPKAEDAEFLPITTTTNLIVNGSAGRALPSFIKFDGKSFFFKPKDLAEKGVYIIQVILEDGYSLPNEYKFNLTVDEEQSKN